MKPHFLPAMAALVLAGCATTKVTHTSTLPQKTMAGATYAFSGDEKGSAASRSLAAQVLTEKSWVRTPARQAEYFVSLDFHTTPVSTETRVTPIYATSSVGGPTMTSGVLVTSGNGSASYAGSIWRTSPVPPAAGRPAERFRREFTVQIAKRATGAIVYRARAVNVSRESDATPKLVRSALQHLP